jgi:Zn-finger nucleic acid-binding protein
MPQQLTCPVCPDIGLRPAQLDDGLPSQSCPKCTGHLLTHEAYFAWRERGGTDLPERLAPPDEPQLNNAKKAKRCPACGRIMRMARVGHGVQTSIDRCGTCGSFWLDANEWQVLKGRNLHDDLHFIHSDAWQADVSRAEREEMRLRLLREKVGNADFAEIVRVRDWLASNPRRVELITYLMETVGPDKPPAKQ